MEAVAIAASSLRLMLDGQLHIELKVAASEARLWFGPLSWLLTSEMTAIVASLYR